MRKNGLKHLTPNERAALDVLVTRLRQKYSKQIAQVILFGSRARGDATGESDFDLLIVTKNGEKKLEKALADFADPIGLAHNLVLSAHVISQTELARKQAQEPFYRSIVSEGVDFYCTPPRRLSRGVPEVYRPPKRRFKMDKNDRIQIKHRLERSRQYLDEALTLLEKKMFPGAVSRAYYAVFTLTTAVLLTLDLVRAKHSGVESAFSEYFIRDKRIEEEYKDIFVRAREERELSDYELKDYSDEETRKILADCERFVARMEKYLRDVGAI